MYNDKKMDPKPFAFFYTHLPLSPKFTPREYDRIEPHLKKKGAQHKKKKYQVLPFNPDNLIASSDATGTIHVHNQGEYAITSIVFAQKGLSKKGKIFIERNGKEIQESIIPLSTEDTEVYSTTTLFLRENDTLSLNSSPLSGEVSLSLMIQPI